MQVQDLGQIANINGASFRSHNNLIAQAQATKHSGPTEPPVIYPNMEWADTGTGFHKVRDQANTRWWVTGVIATSDGPPEVYSKGAPILTAAQIHRLDALRVVTEYGVKADGSTDDTAAINSAIAAMPAGGALYFPPGAYKVSDKIVINKPGRYFGDGYYSCSFWTSSPTKTIVEISAPCEVSGFAFNSSVQRVSGSIAVDIAASNVRLDNFMASGQYCGVRVRDGTSTVRISRGQIMQTLPDIGVCILIQGGFSVSIHDLIANADKNCESGVKIVNCGDVTIDSFNIANAGKCIALEPGSDGAIASVVASHGFLDTSIHGLFAVTETGGSIVRCAFKQCWFGSHAQYGAYISSEFGGIIDGVDLLLPHVFLNGLDGIHASGAGTRNVNINAAEIAQNGGAGASFSASASSFSVMNSAIGDVCGLTGNTYGVYVGPGCVRYRVIGNDLFGNTSPLLDAGSIGLVKDNLGAPL